MSQRHLLLTYAVPVLTIAAVLLLMMNAPPAKAIDGVWGGSGTVTDPYTISDATDLALLATNVNGGNTYAGEYFLLTADINLAVWDHGDGCGWMPIGNGTNRFAGTFDGSGHAIKNLFINRTTDYVSLFSYYIGLFGCVDIGGVVKNLGIVGGAIVGNVIVGSVVGYNYGGTVTNCYNTGAVSGDALIGGVIGNNCGMVTNCYNTGAVTGNHSVGGIAGSNSSTGTVTNCYNKGAVTGNRNYIGSVVGFNPTGSTVADCYYNGDNHSGRGIGTADPGSATSLTTANMTVNDVLTNGMNCLGPAFEKRWNDSNLYYPELAVFKNSADNVIQKSSKQSVLAGETLFILESIAITKLPYKVDYFEGETLDLTGLETTATYSDGSSAVVTSSCIASPADGFVLSWGVQTITVSYMENSATKTTTFTVNVKPTLIKVDIERDPTAPVIICPITVGDLLVGYIFIATYSDGSTADITDSCMISPGKETPLTPLITTIYIFYAEGGITWSTSFSVTVKAQLISIDVTWPPVKTYYYYGDIFDPTGLEVTATYSDGATAVVTDGCTISFDPETGTIIISYTECGITRTTSFSVTVNPAMPAVLTGISVTNIPTEAAYTIGETLDLSGFAVTAIYSNGSTRDVINLCTISPNRELILPPGSTTICITYEENGVAMMVSFTVYVERELIRIDVTNMPDKTDYLDGDLFDLAGLEITATYSDGSTALVTGYTTFPAHGEILSWGTQPVTVTYTEGSVIKTTSFTVNVKAPLVWLQVTMLPDKVEYFYTESLNLTGLEITAKYADGRIEVVTDYCAFSPPEGFILGWGTWTIYVMYEENGIIEMTSFTVNVVSKLLGITVTPPSRVNYCDNCIFDFTGLEVTATYSDGPTKIVTGDCKAFPEGGFFPRWGTVTIIVMYTENGITKTASFTINVYPALVSIAITNLPDKLDYYDGDVFDPTGLKVTATYSDGSTAVVTGYDISIDPTTGTITITYIECCVTKWISFTVNVKPVLVSIAVTTMPDKVNYLDGEVLDLTGLEITATYSDGSTEVVTGDCRTIPDDGFFLSYGIIAVYITYTENSIIKSDYFHVEVRPMLVSIAITQAPDKVYYRDGEALDLTGIVITATYSDDSTAVVTDDCDFSPPNGFILSGGILMVYVTYTECAVTEMTSFSFSTYTMPNIAVTKVPDKVDYYDGEVLDLAGLEITVMYYDGSTAVVTDYCVMYPSDGFILSWGISTTIYVVYEENGVMVTTYFNVYVKAPLASIDVTNMPSKTYYLDGETLDITGLEITATYADGRTEVVTDYCDFSPPAGFFLSLGTQTITVMYIENGYIVTTTLSVTVNSATPAVLTGISIATTPAKVTYITGEVLDISGLVVTATHSNGTSATVSGYTLTLTAGTKLNNAGAQTIYVMYTEGSVTKVTSFTVTVTAAPAPVTLSGTSVTAMPTKTVYTVGEALDLSGLVVTAMYNNGTNASVSGYTTTVLSGTVLKSAGTQMIYVLYTEGGVTKVTSFTVTVTN